jgi:conjugal transfer pilus assembly protein TraF
MTHYIRVASVTAILMVAASLAMSQEVQQATTSAKGEKRGWFWYDDPAKKAAKTAELAASAPAPAGGYTPAQAQDLAKFKDFQRRVDEGFQIAIINPSESNVKNFMQLWREARVHASRVTDMVQVMSWRNPGVDDSMQGVRPPNPTAMQVFDDSRAESKDRQLQALAKTHGLFFFFRSDCKFCHAYAPYLKRFATRYGFVVIPVSMDGGALPSFPDARTNNGIAGKFMAELGIGPEQFQVPFTVLARPGTKEVLPVGFGVMNTEEIGEHIFTVLDVERQQRAAPTGRAMQASPGFISMGAQR